MSRSTLSLSLLAVSLMAAGCLGGPARTSGSGGGEDDVAHAPVEAWSPGSWWSFRVLYDEAKSFDVTLVVAETHPTHHILGSNVTNGFFGLPFNGTVKRPNLEPMLGGEPWRLFDFPLEVGKTWTYALFGHELVARVVGVHGGIFDLEATSFGQRIMTYTYDPDAGFFSRLAIFDPGEGGAKVVEATLLDHGDAYSAGYYVTVPVRTIDARFPDTTTGASWKVDPRYERLTALMLIEGSAGEFRARLLDPFDRVQQAAQVHVYGVAYESRAVDVAPGLWKLEVLGLGVGRLHFEMLGVEARGAPSKSPPIDASVDLAAILAAAQPPRTTPALPHEGHTTLVSLSVVS
ncbi:MAG TPA: hypothetical protein VM889_02245 [Candidatus Thermoplasmatota archaeon]|nr:hypothetical protein [Candidatus Thermoplasmatota archaeon]